MERFYWVWSQTNAVTVTITLGLSNEGKGSEEYAQIRGNLQMAKINPYPTGNGMVLHFYQQQESSTTKTVHKVINKGLKAYV